MVLGITPEELLTPNLVTGNSNWGEYVVKASKSDKGAIVYHVLNGKGEPTRHTWQTFDGAAACAELLAEGYLKE